MTWFLRILALLFGGVFVYAGVMKLRDPHLFLMDVRSFDLLPDPYAAWLALSLPWLEIIAGLAVITGIAKRGGLLLLNLCLIAFFIAILSAWQRGIDIQCGCFGATDATANYAELFIRDGILLAMGITLLLVKRPRADQLQEK
jgi:putative oxidoreductase